jgi:2-dehydro-3-deoxyphosphogluconate aldolase/(4S)-4-hydroxy-2-oxoglutarate aldolase
MGKCIFGKHRILGILRTAGPVDMEGLMGSIASSGLEAIEIAMNSSGAAGLIRRAVKASDGRITIGAGTVLTHEILNEALDAGASFVVMPTLVHSVVEYCVKNSIPVFPGALTPKEVYDAWSAGATMVKVFPVSVLGPLYIKELKAPFDKLELLACGGITPENIKSYFSSGASAVAFGASIFNKERIEKKDFKRIERSIRDLIDGVK